MMRRFFYIAGVLAAVVVSGMVIGCDGDDGENPVDPGPTEWFLSAIDTTNFTGSFTSIAVDQAGLPHIAYVDITQDDLNYAYFDGNVWHVSLIDADVLGDAETNTPTTLCLDSDGNPHVAYCDLFTAELRYATMVGGVWDIDTVDASGSSVVCVSLALDRFDRPYISYGKQIDSTEGLYVAFIDEDDDWTIREIDITAPVIYSSAAVDGDGVMHIAYVNGNFSNKSLRYVNGLAFSWVRDTIAVTGAGGFCDIALTSNGSPRLVASYLNGGGLTYLTPSGGDWQAESVTYADTSSHFPRLVLDASDTPHLCYARVDSLNLVYAVRNGAWVVEAVDTLGAVGIHCDLALDGAGRPHISYFDLGNQDLRYAVKK